ncbi:MAG: transcriptional antiterminator [Desulfobacteraceae bacterium 4572_19]|nr:MAG: transcriptional antiterminator [Desulfobacteraceae bacterium 4572_19]
MIKTSNELNWYVLHTRSKFENVVNDSLLKKSMESFLPKIKVRSKRKDRKAIISVPLFPGYVFIKTSIRADIHLNILKTVGVVRFLGFNAGPAPVPEDSIESLKIMVTAQMPITTGSQFKKGEKVIVTRGALSGTIGFFARYGGVGRIVINIDVLGQFAAVDISEDDIEALPDNIAS